MRILVVLLAFLLPLLCQAQNEAGVAWTPVITPDTTKYYYFTKPEVLAITNGVKLLELKIATQDTLLSLYRQQTSDFKSALRLSDSIIANQAQQIQLYKVNELNYEKLAELSKPSFWQSPILWGVLGLVSGLVLGVLVGVAVGSIN